jgi:probable rRNA maturation factor
MQRFNSRFAGKNSPTDVLSFPADLEEEPYLGDILISSEAAHRRCKDSPLRELKILALHGLLHLMGYDHETDNGEMYRFEELLREEFGLNREG